MPRRVLVAEDDLHFQQVVSDILEITIKDAQLERVMSLEALRTRLEDPDARYALVLVSDSFTDDESLDIPALCERYPHISGRLIILRSTHSRIDPLLYGETPWIVKPFSLDSFSEMVEKICGS